MAINVCKNVEPMDMPPPLSSYIAPILGLNINKLIIFDIAPRSLFLLNDIRNNQFDTYLRKYFYLNTQFVFSYNTCYVPFMNNV